MANVSAPVLITDLRGEIEAQIRLAAPIALAQMGFIAMGLVETAIMGRSSVDDLAAMAMARSIGGAVTSFGLGVALALDPLASQAIGAGRPDRAWSALVATLRAGLWLSLPIIALAFAVTLLLEPFGVDPGLVPRVRWYLLGSTGMMVSFGAFLAGKSYLQAHGVTRPAVIAAVAGNIVNAVACGLLVLGDEALRMVHLPAVGLPRLGALGAGISASLGMATLAAVVLTASRGLKADPIGSEGAISTGTVLRVGVPVGLQLLAEVGAFTIASLVVGRYGAKIVSAHQIAMGLASFTFMGALGVGGATATRVGLAVGAGVSARRAGLVGLGLGALVMSVGAAAFATIPADLVGIFTGDALVIGVGVTLVQIAALFQLFDGLQAVAASALRGAGDVRYPFLAMLAAHWVVGFPVALALSFWAGLGAKGIWWGFTAGLFTVAVLLCGRFWWLSGRRIARVA